MMPLPTTRPGPAPTMSAFATRLRALDVDAMAADAAALAACRTRSHDAAERCATDMDSAQTAVLTAVAEMAIEARIVTDCDAAIALALLVTLFDLEMGSECDEDAADMGAALSKRLLGWVMHRGCIDVTSLVGTLFGSSEELLSPPTTAGQGRIS